MAGFALTTKSAARSTAFGLAAAAALFAGSNAYANDFSENQCKVIAATGIAVAKKVGVSNLSPEFKKSFRNYLGQHLTCDGPKDIQTPNGADIDAFNAMRTILLAPPAGISLEKAGLRSVDSRDVALREQRRSELPSPRPGG